MLISFIPGFPLYGDIWAEAVPGEEQGPPPRQRHGGDRPQAQAVLQTTQLSVSKTNS